MKSELEFFGRKLDSDDPRQWILFLAIEKAGLISSTRLKRRSSKAPLLIRNSSSPLMPHHFRYFSECDRRIVSRVRGGGISDYLYGSLYRAIASSRSAYRQEVVQKLESQLVRTRGGDAFWANLIKEEGKIRPFVNLGIPRGMAGAALILSYLADAGVERMKCLHMLEAVVRFLLKIHQVSPEYYPGFWFREKKTYPTRNAWCYGDLAVGFALTRSGRALGDSAVTRSGASLFSRGVLRAKRDGFEDLSLCHGLAGAHCLLKSYRENFEDDRFLSEERKLRASFVSAMKSQKMNFKENYSFPTSSWAVWTHWVELTTRCSAVIPSALLLTSPFSTEAR